MCDLPPRSTRKHDEMEEIVLKFVVRELEKNRIKIISQPNKICEIHSVEFRFHRSSCYRSCNSFMIVVATKVATLSAVKHTAIIK